MSRRRKQTKRDVNPDPVYKYKDGKKDRNTVMYEERKTEAVADPEGYDDGESAMFRPDPIEDPIHDFTRLLKAGKNPDQAAIEVIGNWAEKGVAVPPNDILDAILDFRGYKAGKDAKDASFKQKFPYASDLTDYLEEGENPKALQAAIQDIQNIISALHTSPVGIDPETVADDIEKYEAELAKLKGSQGSLNEAATKPEGAYKSATGKAEYDKFAEMDRVDYRQLMKGTEFELLKMPEITDENLVKAKTKAYKALIKNPKAYMHLVTTNADEVEKKDKDLRMQPVKGDNKVDKANAMKVIKKDEGSNTQTNLSNKEKAKGNPKGVKEMLPKGVIGTEKVLRESLLRQLRESILDEMMEVGAKQTTHNKGEVVKKKGSNKVGT